MDTIDKLKEVYKPSKLYMGEFSIDIENLKKIAIIQNNKNLFESFLERYYYMALNVIFKNDDLVNYFKCGIESRVVKGVRSLYFSPKAFLRNFIVNIDEILKNAKDEDKIYQAIKKEIRIKKDMYRDVYNLKYESTYYNDIKNEYKNCNVSISFDEFVLECKKKYTKLLSGYNAVIEFFNKSIDLNKFMECFDVEQLYLYTMLEILEFNENSFDLYGKVNYNIYCLEEYVKFVTDKRKKQPFYNSIIAIDNTIWTIDDLIKRYQNFCNE